jgi:hypothetical protein
MFLPPVCDCYLLNSILLRMIALFIEVCSFLLWWCGTSNCLRLFATQLILTPGVIAMIIAATRMHRTLAGCAFGSLSTSGYDTLYFLFLFILLSASDVLFSPNSLELGSIAYTRSKPTPPTPTRIEVTVHRDFEQHLASPKTDNESTEGSNVQTVHEKPNISWSVRDDVERGEV